MPALWESSKRPMFVKTVWLDGFRHAILTRDDPALVGRQPRRRRPASCASYAGQPARRDPGLLTVKQFQQSRLSHSGDQLEECLRKLRLVLTVEDQAQSAIGATEHAAEEQEDAECNDGESDAYNSAAGRLRPDVSTQPINEPKHSKPTADMRANKAGKSPRQDAGKEKNDLSERVFHWLDLAGKIDLYFPEPGEPARSQAQPRHSCPDIQRRHLPNVTGRARLGKESNRIFGDKCKRIPEKLPVTAADETNTLDFSPRIAGPSNTIENYAKLSRPQIRDGNACQLSKVELMRDTGKILAKARERSYRATAADPIQEAREKVAAEMTEVERKYADLVSKSVITNGYSRQAARRQVHIFMPPVPKRPQASASTTRSDLTVSTGSQLSL